MLLLAYESKEGLCLLEDVVAHSRNDRRPDDRGQKRKHC